METQTRTRIQHEPCFSSEGSALGFEIRIVRRNVAQNTFAVCAVLNRVLLVMAASSSSGGMSHGVAKRVSSRASQICPSDAYERNLQSRDYSCAAKRERDRQRRALHEGAPTNDRVPHAQPQDATELLPLPPHVFLHIDYPDNQLNTLSATLLKTPLHHTQFAIILCEYDADVIEIVDVVNAVLPVLQCNFLSNKLRDVIKARRWECYWLRDSMFL